MILIIYAHPSHETHNGKILARVKKVLSEKNLDYKLIDLYQEDFEARLTNPEYTRIINRDRTLDEDVKKYQALISEAKTIIFIYPTWWYNMPAILKGFMDRVFISGFSYRFFRVNKFMLMGAWFCSWIPGLRYLLQPFSVTGYLKDKKAIIFRTYGGPKLGRRMFGNTHTVLENVILRFCGLTKIKIHELFNIDKPQTFLPIHETRYMQKVEDICARLEND